MRCDVFLSNYYSIKSNYTYFIHIVSINIVSKLTYKLKMYILDIGVDFENSLVNKIKLYFERTIFWKVEWTKVNSKIAEKKFFISGTGSRLPIVTARIPVSFWIFGSLWMVSWALVVRDHISTARYVMI